MEKWGKKYPEQVLQKLIRTKLRNKTRKDQSLIQILPRFSTKLPNHPLFYHPASAEKLKFAE